MNITNIIYNSNVHTVENIKPWMVLYWYSDKWEAGGESIASGPHFWEKGGPCKHSGQGTCYKSTGIHSPSSSTSKISGCWPQGQWSYLLHVISWEIQTLKIKKRANKSGKKNEIRFSQCSGEKMLLFIFCIFLSNKPNTVYYKYCWLFDKLLLLPFCKSLYIKAPAKCRNVNVKLLKIWCHLLGKSCE